MKNKDEKIILPKDFFTGMGILTIVFIVIAFILWILGGYTNPFVAIAIFLGFCTLVGFWMN